MKIPYWKLKREVRRIKDQFLGTLIYPLEILRTRRYDRDKHRLTRITNGHIPLSDQVAVFLVGHPASERAGVEHTLKHLVEQNLSTILVINDSARCLSGDWYLKYCSVVICRPNYGYDFGGYRDGVLWLRDQGQTLSELLLINDSIWFPLANCDETIEGAREASETVFGLLALEKQNTWNRDLNLQPRRVGSFFVFIKGGVLRQPELWSFWRQMILSNIKRSVIQRGEHGLSDVLLGLGQSFSFALSRSKIRLRVMSMTEEQVASLVEEVEPTERPVDLTLAREALIHRLSYPNPLLGLPEILLRLDLLPFIKKSLEYQSAEALSRVAPLLRTQPGVYNQAIIEEVSKRLNMVR